MAVLFFSIQFKYPRHLTVPPPVDISEDLRGWRYEERSMSKNRFYGLMPSVAFCF